MPAKRDPSNTQSIPIADGAAMDAIAGEFDQRLKLYLEDNPEVRVLLDLRPIPDGADSVTGDPEELNRRVAELLRRGSICEPQGSQHPSRQPGEPPRYERDPRVKAYVLYLAQGQCQLCDRPGPFMHREYRMHFLEVHHVRRLADGGPDTVDNCVAVCPNCHRKLHQAIDRDAFRSALLAKVARLKDW